MPKNRGFTLVELLIAITLLSLLAAVSIASFRSSQRNTRDGRRKGDMVALQQAFEQYFAVNATYNATCSVMATNYIQGAYPQDPVGAAGGHSDYADSCSTTSYCICAELEVVGKGNSRDSNCDFSGAGSRDWFCVQNQQ